MSHDYAPVVPIECEAPPGSWTWILSLGCLGFDPSGYTDTAWTSSAKRRPGFVRYTNSVFYLCRHFREYSFQVFTLKLPTAFAFPSGCVSGVYLSLCLTYSLHFVCVGVVLGHGNITFKMLESFWLTRYWYIIRILITRMHVCLFSLMCGCFSWWVSFLRAVVYVYIC